MIGNLGLGGLLALLNLSLVLSQRAVASSYIDCHLRHIAMDLPADDDATGARGISKCNPVTLCCPPSTPPHSDTGCIVLYEMDMAALRDVQPDELIRVTPTRPTGAISAAGAAAAAPAPGARAAANISSLPAATRASFGGLAAVTGAFIIDPHGARRRRLALSASDGGALFVNRTAFHGARTTLHVIVRKQDPGNGDVKAFTLICREFNVRKMFFGSDGGSNYVTGASPYALRPKCQTGADGTCRFNTRDHFRAVTQRRVDFRPLGAKVVTLDVLPNYPPEYCAFYKIINLVRDAVRKTGVNPDAFNHMIVYVPRHCAIGQGEQPGKNVIVQMCPGGDRDNLYSAISHELGHNLGLGHGSIYQGSAYGDGSSFMGAGGGGRVSTLNLAHRHAFNWLPGGSANLFVNTADDGNLIARVLKLSDLNVGVLPAGAVWGAKIDDDDASWYVGYRGCTGTDFTTRPEWCGGVQISRRFGSKTQGFHHAWLRAAGERLSFGTNTNFITVVIGSVAAPVSLEAAGVVGGLAITISVKRTL
jgi:hypothetical protein